MRWKRAVTAVGPTEPLTEQFRVGTKVYVRDRYLGNWCSGFTVAEVHDDGYRLRRLSDGRVLPDLFPFADVHMERRQAPRHDDAWHWDGKQFP